MEVQKHKFYNITDEKSAGKSVRFTSKCTSRATLTHNSLLLPFNIQYKDNQINGEEEKNPDVPPNLTMLVDFLIKILTRFSPPLSFF